MAFNPFSWFRKHQRMLIAVVTIFIMFLFILSFGRGDFFDWLGNKIGRDRSGTITRINGNAVSALTQEDAASRRRSASDFLFIQAQEHHSKVLTEMLKSDFKDVRGTGAVSQVEELRTVAGHTMERQNGMRELPQLIQMARQFGPQVLQGFLRRSLEQLRHDLTVLNRIGSDKEFFADRTDRAALVEKLATVIGLQRYQYAQLMRREPQDLYFGGYSKSVDDTLDFLMWRDQARKLGVQLTDADLAREINREAAGAEVFDPEKVDFDRDPKIQAHLNRRDYGGQVKAKDFVEALRDEFRVAIAQGVLLGTASGVRSYRDQLGASDSPAAVTPDEFLNFYREHRTTMKGLFLAVSAEKFLDKVTQKPTEEELRARYDKYRDKEEDPTLRDPGFKEPRRVVVQYVTADANHASYRDGAKKMAALFADRQEYARRAFGAAAGAPSILGAGPLGVAATLLTPISLDPLGQDYDAYLNSQPSWLSWGGTEQDESRSRTQFREASAASGRAVLLALAGLSDGPLAALSGLAVGATAEELRGSIRQAGALLTFTDAQNAFGAAAQVLAAQPDTLTYPHAQPQLLASLEDRLARGQMYDQLETIRAELSRLKKQPKLADEYLQKALATYPALKLSTMPAPRSLLALVDELDKKADVKLAGVLGAMQKRFRADRDRDLAFQFFQDQGEYEPRLVGGAFGRDLDQSDVLWWRKEDLPARVRPFADVRGDVERAWKMERARALARAEAERLAAEIVAKNWNAADAERYLREQRPAHGEVIELENVSLLWSPPREVHLPVQVEYRPYDLPQDKQQLMQYTVARDVVRGLMTLDKPGQATVIADLPQRTFYVAVLAARDEPNVKDFLSRIYSQTSMRGAPGHDMLFTIFTQQRAEEYRRGLVEAMRRDAGKVGKDGRWDIAEEHRKRESRSEEAPE